MINRRNFLSKIGLGAVGVAAAAAVPELLAKDSKRIDVSRVHDDSPEPQEGGPYYETGLHYGHGGARMFVYTDRIVSGALPIYNKGADGFFFSKTPIGMKAKRVTVPTFKVSAVGTDPYSVRKDIGAQTVEHFLQLLAGWSRGKPQQLAGAQRFDSDIVEGVLRKMEMNDQSLRAVLYNPTNQPTARARRDSRCSNWVEDSRVSENRAWFVGEPDDKNLVSGIFVDRGCMIKKTSSGYEMTEEFGIVIGASSLWEVLFERQDFFDVPHWNNLAYAKTLNEDVYIMGGEDEGKQVFRLTYN